MTASRLDRVLVLAGVILVGACGAKQPPALPGGAPHATAFTTTGPGDIANPVKIGDQVTSPVKTKHADPAYPREAQSRKIQGVVYLETTVDTLGKVRDIKVLKSPSDILTEAAIQAVARWEYTPTLLDGKAVPVIMTVTTIFKLTGR